MPTDSLRPGDPRELGGYRLLGRLGEGGMGAVYLGRAADGRLVAVKAIRPDLAWDPEFRGRFRSEVNRARAVPAFCTAPVLDADPDHATPYLVVEYVDGPSLAEVVSDRGPLTGGDLYSVAVGVATALTAIHGAGVIHRDLKPRNVLFSLGTPKVIDFGIARAFEATSNHTRTDQMVGTVAYMAPERFDTDSKAGVGPAADVFAWGVVVAYAGTGRTPFHADSPAATAARILTQPPDLGGLPSPLREIVARTLAKEPADRPTSPELLDLLLDTGSHSLADLTGRPVLQQAARAARSEGRRRAGAGGRPGNRRRLMVAAAAGVAALVAAGAWAMGGRPGTQLGPAGMSAASSAPVVAATPAPIGNGPVIIDPLDREGQWAPWRDANGSCAFAGGRLVVRAADSYYPVCPGPRDIFAGDQSVSVTAALLERGSCAYIGFRRVEDTFGYALSLCADRVTVSLDANDANTEIGSVRSTALADRAEHRVQLLLRGSVATVLVDGAKAAEAAVADRRLISGWITLGLETDPDNLEASGVAYRNLEIRSL